MSLSCVMHKTKLFLYLLFFPLLLILMYCVSFFTVDTRKSVQMMCMIVFSFIFVNALTSSKKSNMLSVSIESTELLYSLKKHKNACKTKTFHARHHLKIQEMLHIWKGKKSIQTLDMLCLLYTSDAADE